MNSDKMEVNTSN